MNIPEQEWAEATIDAFLCRVDFDFDFEDIVCKYNDVVEFRGGEVKLNIWLHTTFLIRPDDKLIIQNFIQPAGWTLAKAFQEDNAKCDILVVRVRCPGNYTYRGVSMNLKHEPYGKESGELVQLSLLYGMYPKEEQ